LKEKATLITDDGHFLEVRNPRSMTVEQVETYEYLGLSSSVANQAFYIFQCCLVNPEDAEVIKELTVDEFGRLLQQMISEFDMDDEEV
jgi:hypothetical protein